ncbi:S-adenosyl-L-methionine-dependent methyltransferase [Protomyces lactucae-debilis]|uniref:Protein arginine methyltransferase NDUFAF7 n=1 Tax=Protomyces lactucae-debilis TaxID=2754530 RepID=A0A1Y2FCG9_PROLT|nr:S-adenosyl-L-methionine-dependent methyltransferase [Protomyces lactucae-debilis]ORY81601.1 S-adenosyl-L-methionine-dependent methyltransferase [Protomyces lactucae-debilis]
MLSHGQYYKLVKISTPALKTCACCHTRGLHSLLLPPRGRSASTSASASQTKTRFDTLAKQLAEVVKTTGPISIAAYMRQCLTHPELGYYTQQTPFGKHGDFVTSPEVSQMFGELVGIWFVTEWMALSKPSVINLIELGPGKGTLLDDMLRAGAKFKAFLQALKCIHLLEASDKLREIQHALVGDGSPIDKSDDLIWHGKSKYGPGICWHADLSTIPKDLSHPMIIAHEFFDAMPIHAFERTEKDWKELLVDTKNVSTVVPAPASESEVDPSFHLTLSKSPSPHGKMLQSPRFECLKPPARVEVSPDSINVAIKLSEIMGGQNQGSALIIDYGPKDTIPVDTLRGIRAHKIVSPFIDPGKVDLSADVDFKAIAEAFQQQGGIYAHGPVEQGHWLHRLGIGARATVLARNAKMESDRKRIEGEYKRLVESVAMGKVYKVMAITTRDVTPCGFETDT